MLKKKEGKQDKLKDEEYYTTKIEELKEKSKKLSLVEKGVYEDESTYQIWSYISDDEEMCNPSHGAMFVEYDRDVQEDENLVKHGDFELGFKVGMFDSEEESDNGEEKNEGKCLMETIAKSLMTANVRNLLISLNIPSSLYDSILSDFDDACANLNDFLISISSDVEKTKVELYEAKNRVEEKNSSI